MVFPRHASDDPLGVPRRRDLLARLDELESDLAELTASLERCDLGLDEARRVSIQRTKCIHEAAELMDIAFQ